MAIQDNNESVNSEMQNHLNEQHALLAAIVASADDAIIGSDLDGNIISWNRAAEILFGYTAAAIYQHPFSSLFPAGQLPDHKSLIKLLQQGVSIGNFETTRRCKDGTELPVALSISAINDHKNDVTGLSLTARDFSVGHRIAARLTRSERHFRQLVDSAPNAMVMIDSRGLIEMVNAQAEQIFGYSRSELLGKPMEILIPARFHRQHPGLRAGYFSNPSIRAMGRGRDLFGLRKDGSEFPVEIGLNPIETDDGIKVLSAIVDISERKRQEERFRLVVEAAPNAMVMIDHRGHIEMVNTQTEQIFGYARAELLGQPMEILIPARFRPQHPGLRSDYFTAPATRSMGTGRDLFGLHKDGSEFPVEIGLNPIETADGLKVLSSIVDISERRRQEERFRLVVEAAPNAMVMIDHRGVIEMVNTQTEHIFGYARAELLGQPMEILIPVRFRPQHPGLRSDYFTAPATRSMGTGRDLFGLRKDGSEFPVEIGLNPIETADGLKVLSSIVDISERKRQEERFRLVVEAAPNAMVMIDHRGHIEMVNTQTEHIFGYARAELLGQPMEILIPARFRPEHPNLRSSYFSTPTTRSMGTGRDLFGLRKDGSEFPVEIGLNPIETPDGLKVLSSIVDISERKRQEERFRLVVEAAPNAMVMIDQRGFIEMVNTQAEHIFGYARAELLGKPMEILIPVRLRPQHPGLRSGYFTAPVTRSMGTGRDLFGLRKDGSEFPVEIGLNPIETADGLKVLSAIVDISERKRFTDELSRRNKELSNFAYVASHDLKSPLRGVDQLATWLTEDLAGKIDEESNEHLRLIRIRIKRMEKLLDDLLLYFRAGQLGGDVEQVDFSELVKDVFELCCINMNFQLELQGDFPNCPTHKVALELVFRNLFNNAIKHHDKQSGLLLVRALSEENYFVFEVADDGAGIAEEHRERVFGMFQTLRPRDEVEGSGMGLAVIKKTIESLGGLITLGENHPRGAVFRFTWPRKPAITE